MVCVREDIPDGRGGVAPTENFSMYAIRDGRITTMIKDNTVFGCVNRTYSRFLPA